jgi:transposase
MDMWKPFRHATSTYAPQPAILFEQFHVIRHLGKALDKGAKSEYARLSGRATLQQAPERQLLSHRKNLTLEGHKAVEDFAAGQQAPIC